MEIGIGIHGEPGRERLPLEPATRSSTCCWSRSSTTCRSGRATGCSLFVNGMGGTPLIELYLVYGEADADPGRARR